MLLLLFFSLHLEGGDTMSGNFRTGAFFLEFQKISFNLFSQTRVRHAFYASGSSIPNYCMILRPPGANPMPNQGHQPYIITEYMRILFRVILKQITVACCTKARVTVTQHTMHFFVANPRFQGMKYPIEAIIPLANNPHLKPAHVLRPFHKCLINTTFW